MKEKTVHYGDIHFVWSAKKFWFRIALCAAVIIYFIINPAHA